MTQNTPSFIPAIEPSHNPDLAARIQHALDTKTKPLNSLGKLESLALQIGLAFRSTAPAFEQPQMLLFAADHGIANKGVSAFPQDVTWQMAANIVQGGAAISVLCRQHQLPLTLVDCGIAHTIAPHPQLRAAKVMAQGTADASETAAMTAEECEQALRVGMQTVQERPGNAILLGELGIGNTSAAALLLAKIGQLPIEDCTGAGTGMHGSAWAHKVAVLTQALERHADVQEPLAILAALGGLEIAAMAGAALQAASERRMVVVDGFVASAAILVAAQLRPQVLDYCVFSHLSHERGHQLMLECLNAHALLQMDLRLGEGSGAALAWPLIDSSCRILCEMASFETAKVSTAC